MPIEGPIARGVTAALRDRSIARLRAEFADFAARESAGDEDDRETMLGLTVFLDCARRLGADPVELFGPDASAGSDRFRKVFERFVRRTDVSLAVMGWRLDETPDGPAYRFAWVRFPPSRPS